MRGVAPMKLWTPQAAAKVWSHAPGVYAPPPRRIIVPRRALRGMAAYGAKQGGHASSAPATGGGGSSTLSGLDYDGNPTGLRMLYWDQSTVGSGNIPDPYPFTVFMKIYTRSNQTITGRDVGGGVQARYGTYIFYGNNGDGLWASSPPGTANNTYWGIEPYPRPAPSGESKLEVATWNQDFTDRDDSGTPGDGPYVTDGEWVSTALVCKIDTAHNGGVNELSGRPQTIHTGWMRLPSTSSAQKITTQPWYVQPSGTIVWWNEPPNRALFIGQSPPDPDVPSNSWGGYPKWDECVGILRGFILIAAELTEAQVVATSAFDYDADVLSYLSGQGLTTPLWYLNMNPKPTDVLDKSGKGHHGAWNHASYRPALWTN